MTYAENLMFRAPSYISHIAFCTKHIFFMHFALRIMSVLHTDLQDFDTQSLVPRSIAASPGSLLEMPALQLHS